MAAGVVSLGKSHDIVILSFRNIVKGQAKYIRLVSVNCVNQMVFFLLLVSPPEGSVRCQGYLR